MKKEGDIYRACASIVVLRPTEVSSPDGSGTVYEVLLLHKPRKRDAWQLPQGGCEEGETLEEAAKRELMEEASLDVHVLGKSDLVYQYDFPASYRRFRPDHVCGQRVEYVFADIPANSEVVVDDNEIDSYVWATLDQFRLYLKRPKYRELVKKLVDEATKLVESNS